MVRYLHPADHHLARIRKTDKLFRDGLDTEDIRFPVKVRDIHEIEQNNPISISVFGYENKEKFPIYVTKNALNKNMLIVC